MISNETRVGWQDYLAIILRRRLFFAVPCALIVVCTMSAGMFLPKIYRAETILMVESQDLMNPLIQGLAVSTPIGQRLHTLKEELLGWTSLSRLVTELKLNKNAKSPLAFESLIKRLQSDIQVRMRGGNLIMIGYEDEDPKLAQTLVNTITTIYMDRNVQSEAAETSTAITFIRSEMAVYKKKLEDAERALREFKELHVTQMPIATQLNQQIVDMEVSLARLLVENTEEHPTVIQIRLHIAELKLKRNEEIRRVIATSLAKGTDPAIYQDLAKALEGEGNANATGDPAVRVGQQAYKAWVDRLDSHLEAVNAGTAHVQVVTVAPNQGNQPIDVSGANSPSISLGPREEQELMRLARDYDVYSQTYQHMQERLERAMVTQRLGDADNRTKFKVLEPARLPLRPVRPNLGKLFLLALFLGAFIGAGVVFLAEYLDQSFQSAEELQAALELPVIGSISTIVTETDLEARRQRRKGWFKAQRWLEQFKTYILRPVWSQLDRVLVRWGL